MLLKQVTTYILVYFDVRVDYKYLYTYVDSV